jgi:hypothetical protein
MGDIKLFNHKSNNIYAKKIIHIFFIDIYCKYPFNLIVFYQFVGHSHNKKTQSSHPCNITLHHLHFDKQVHVLHLSQL